MSELLYLAVNQGDSVEMLEEQDCYMIRHLQAELDQLAESQGVARLSDFVIELNADSPEEWLEQGPWFDPATALPIFDALLPVAASAPEVVARLKSYGLQAAELSQELGVCRTRLAESLEKGFRFHFASTC